MKWWNSIKNSFKTISNLQNIEAKLSNLEVELESNINELETMNTNNLDDITFNENTPDLQQLLYESKQELLREELKFHEKQLGH